MESKFKVGDKVKVKSFEEIKKTLDSGNYSKRGLYFNSDMKIECGKTFTIKVENSQLYTFVPISDDPHWTWEEEWLEPAPKFELGDLAVIKPDLVVGNKYVTDKMAEARGTVVTIKSIAEDYTMYMVEENNCFYTGEMLLTLEEAFIPGAIVTYKNKTLFLNGETTATVKYLAKNTVWLIEMGMLEAVTALKLVNFGEIEQRLYTPPTKVYPVLKGEYGLFEETPLSYKQFNPTKNKNYENQLQRKKTRIRRADIPEGNRVCCGKRKASVVFGHLSNQARAGF